jgi:hypothetical protein
MPNHQRQCPAGVAAVTTADSVLQHGREQRLAHQCLDVMWACIASPVPVDDESALTETTLILVQQHLQPLAGLCVNNATIRSHGTTGISRPGVHAHPAEPRIATISTTKPVQLNTTTLNESCADEEGLRPAAAQHHMPRAQSR